MSSITAISSTVLSSSKDLTKFNQTLLPRLCLSSDRSSLRRCFVKFNIDKRMLRTQIAFSGSGTGNGNGSGRNGGDGSGGGDGIGGNGNEKDAMMVLPEGDESSDSILEPEMSKLDEFKELQERLLAFADPLFMIIVVRESDVRELNKGRHTLLQMFKGFKERLLATDPLFRENVVMEIYVFQSNKVKTFKASQDGILDGILKSTIKKTTDHFEGPVDNTSFAKYRMKCGANRLLSEEGRFCDSNPKMSAGLDLLDDPLFVAKIVMEFRVGTNTKVVTFKEGGILKGISQDLGAAIKRMIIHFGGPSDNNFLDKYKMKCGSNRP
ncbi:hypothetical protein E3N88_16193 [Mikania micrantha]|uniref:Uncharacterized protein n=1 Tax=Mikania micrantha TaxID=192012 RepID=A0A5N6NZV2_9ASTR|nr:hypothetical protein E3N88_16193 [Mikania micrantha]